MSEVNKAIVRRYYEEIWNQPDLALVDELFAAGYANYDPATPGTVVRGRDGFKQLILQYRTAFPDLKFTVVEQIAEGDRVVTRWHARGTHQGPLMGIPPTGRSGEGIFGITITRFVEGKIVEDQVVWDTLGLLRQLGILPAVSAA